jgi:hypothetical protein
MKKDIDIHKKDRDKLDLSLENKFMNNLQWSMLFFCFNQISHLLNKDNEFEDDHYIQKHFIKTWLKFAHSNIVSLDLEVINNILNSPKNIFYSALQNDNEVTESTEIYQEKYNIILKNIEKFFLDTLNSQKKLDSTEEDE